MARSVSRNGSDPSRTAAGKDVGKVKKVKKTAKKRARGAYNIYLYRVLKHTNKDMGVSRNAMSVLNSFCDDIFTRLSIEAERLATAANRRTVTSREIQTAARLVLPAELARHALSEGTKALNNYEKSKKQ